MGALKKITLRQMTDLYVAIKNMGNAGVSVKGLGMYELAIDKAKIEPAIIKYEEECMPPDRVREYNSKIAISRTDDERYALRAEYAVDIEQFNKKSIELARKKEEKMELDLIMIKKADLIIDEKNGKAAEILFGLLPVIE